MKASYPRLVVAGTKGDSGKTMVSLGLLLALKEMGYAPSAFKKGPDFIDAAWLGWATDGPGRNLDTFIMGPDRVISSFFANASPDNVNLVEGNRGIHDGSDALGTHSTAELAKHLQAPAVLVLPVTKTTRTAAALVLGCKNMDPDLNIAGIIINQYAGPRHKRVTSEAIENYTGIPVIGAIPKLRADLIPNRHLGLKTLAETSETERLRQELLKMINEYVDMDKVVRIAHSAPTPELRAQTDVPEDPDGRGLTIGMLYDEAFSFYYPENVEALERAGARVVKISAFESEGLPDELDGLFIGGGFPELHLDRLCTNRRLMKSINERANAGLPIYAECGGLMYLSQSIEYKGATFPLCGVLPVDLNVTKKPQGHGYCEVVTDTANPFFTQGTVLRGHEFHYSGIATRSGDEQTAFSVKRGTGCFDKRDGLTYKNVLASYLHLHAMGSPQWVKGMIKAAKSFRLSVHPGDGSYAQGDKTGCC